ncbi:DUF4181 domain-containing protein [Planococcus salinarum]|uniref:DUF4181 domain-containing protein n=1 Tax=Planococcus salinarum TaxID=622695 RepID=UPI000E3D13CD|nr:DUF4181 domain-containing protein [Planococcus salinarum]TAA65830.1 DUF4181 domain-containing protein [Planococcus salinarum]
MPFMDLLLFFLIVVAINSVLKFTLRKLFNIEPSKREFFSYNHINDLHRKVDWFVRIGTLIAGLVLLYFVALDEDPPSYYLVAIIAFIVVDHLVRAFFEWRASENPKQSILTLTQMMVFVAATVFVLQFNFFLFGGFEGVVTEKTDTSFMVEVTSFNLEIGPTIHEVHMTDDTLFKGEVRGFDELEEGTLVRVRPFDLPSDFPYKLASEVIVE